MSERTGLWVLLLWVFLSMAAPFVAHADTFAVCASPGPSGEYVYCADDVERMPKSTHGRLVLTVIPPLHEYGRYSHVEDVTEPHRWWDGCRARYYRPRHRIAGMDFVVPFHARPFLRGQLGKRVYPFWGDCR